MITEHTMRKIIVDLEDSIRRHIQDDEPRQQSSNNSAPNQAAKTITLKSLPGSPTFTFEKLMYRVGEAPKVVGISTTLLRRAELEGQIARNKFGMFDIVSLCNLAFNLKEEKDTAAARKAMNK